MLCIDISFKFGCASIYFNMYKTILSTLCYQCLCKITEKSKTYVYFKYNQIFCKLLLYLYLKHCDYKQEYFVNFLLEYETLKNSPPESYCHFGQTHLLISFSCIWQRHLNLFCNLLSDLQPGLIARTGKFVHGTIYKISPRVPY